MIKWVLIIAHTSTESAMVDHTRFACLTFVKSKQSDQPTARWSIEANQNRNQLYRLDSLWRDPTQARLGQLYKLTKSYWELRL